MIAAGIEGHFIVNNLPFAVKIINVSITSYNLLDLACNNQQFLLVIFTLFNYVYYQIVLGAARTNGVAQQEAAKEAEVKKVEEVVKRQDDVPVDMAEPNENSENDAKEEVDADINQTSDKEGNYFIIFIFCQLSISYRIVNV